ncbi:hypothetical protein RJ641_032997, partial [Dillenia turbinata]
TLIEIEIDCILYPGANFYVACLSMFPSLLRNKSHDIGIIDDINDLSFVAGPLHDQAGNNHLNSKGFLNEVSSNESTTFDPSDFSQPSGVPLSSSVSQGQLGNECLLRKQNAGVIQQNQEFSIRNEDFPALPVYKGSTVLDTKVLDNSRVRLVQ